MDMTTWAEREIELAIAREKAGDDSGECCWDYGVACYESALKAFKCLCDDGHSGMSIKITQNILNRLIDGRPLTTIEDTPDVWDDRTSNLAKGIMSYRCNRMSGLFKDVYPDGTVKYTDVNRVTCVDIKNPHNTYHSGLVRRLIDEMYPITMPYSGTTMKVICEDFLTDPKNGDFDTVGVHVIRFNDGSEKRIGRYFKEDGPGWKEIDKLEYTDRKYMAGKLIAEVSNEH